MLDSAAVMTGIAARLARCAVRGRLLSSDVRMQETSAVSRVPDLEVRGTLIRDPQFRRALAAMSCANPLETLQMDWHRHHRDVFPVRP